MQEVNPTAFVLQNLFMEAENFAEYEDVEPPGKEIVPNDNVDHPGTGNVIVPNDYENVN